MSQPTTKSHQSTRITSKSKDKSKSQSSANSKLSSSTKHTNQNHKIHAKSRSSVTVSVSSAKPTDSSAKAAATLSGAEGHGGVPKSKAGKHPAGQNGGSKSKPLSRSVSPMPSQRASTPSKVVAKAKLSTSANFQNLIKIAQLNTETATSKPDEVKTKGQPSSASRSKGNTPVGKSLVDRVHQRSRGHQLLPNTSTFGGSLVTRSTGPTCTSTSRQPSETSKTKSKTVAVGDHRTPVKQAQGRASAHEQAPLVRSDLGRRPLKEGGGGVSRPSLGKQSKTLGTWSV